MEMKMEREMEKDKSEEIVELEKRGGMEQKGMDEEELEEKEVNGKKEMEGGGDRHRRWR